MEFINRPMAPAASATEKLYMRAKLAEQFGICYRTPHKIDGAAQRHYSGFHQPVMSNRPGPHLGGVL